MSAIIETAKVAIDLVKKGTTVGLQEKLMELREEALELQEENLALKKENLDLKGKIELRDNIQFKRKVYFRDGDETPFCPYCYEKSKLLIHLTGTKNDLTEQFCNCQECEITYRTVNNEDFTVWDRPRN